MVAFMHVYFVYITETVKLFILCNVYVCNGMHVQYWECIWNVVFHTYIDVRIVILINAIV